MVRCECGEDINPEMRFCPHCGKEQARASQQLKGGTLQDSVLVRSNVGQASVGNINIHTAGEKSHRMMVCVSCSNPITEKNEVLVCEEDDSKFCQRCEFQFRRGIPRQPREPVLCRKCYREYKKNVPAYAKPATPTIPKPSLSSAGMNEAFTNSIGAEFRLIPEGTFLMGDETWGNSKPLHHVRITKPFYLGIYPLTQREWKKVMGDNPSKYKGDHNPVERVSWVDCQTFIERLNEMEQENCYRLPSEAEWEYACRAGSTKKYCFGNRESELVHHAWYDANSGSKTHPVGKKNPNAWGLYDMHGNVSEWCRDWYSKDYYRECEEEGEVEDPEGPGVGSIRVLRGGAWNINARNCPAGARGGGVPGTRSILVGFRLARSLP